MRKPIQHHEHPSGLIDGSVSYFTASVSPTRESSKGFEFNQTRQFLLCYLRGLKIDVTMKSSIEPCICKYYILVAATVSSRLLLYLRYFTRHEMNRKNKAWIRIEYHILRIFLSRISFFFHSSSREKNFCLYKLLLKEKISIFNSSSSFFPLLQTS